MKKKISSILVSLSLLFSQIAIAQDIEINPDPDPKEKSTTVKLPPSPQPLPGEPDVGDAISPMKKGQVAPFTGLLLSPSAVATIISDIQTQKDRTKLEVKRATSLLHANHEHEKAIIKIRNESDSRISQLRIDQQKKELDRLDSLLKKEREDRANPATWVSIGVVGGVILSTLTAAVIVSVSNNN